MNDYLSDAWEETMKEKLIVVHPDLKFWGFWTATLVELGVGVAGELGGAYRRVGATTTDAQAQWPGVPIVVSYSPDPMNVGFPERKGHDAA